ncbi:MAG: ATP-binding cassette domain-containing protein [Tissierellia bacterium]|nr:ATP-binding cassette domain-containing protein [Tissierellia bacterium]
MEIVKFEKASFKDQDHEILSDISFSINEGDLVLLIGPSGSGKSTLLKLINNLISLTKGRILYRQRDIESYDPIKLRREISYCLQTPILFGKTVKDNMDFVFNSRGLAYDASRVREVMDCFEMDENYLDKEVINLSGGEKQRLALVRSILMPPKVLLLDEVTSALDEANASIVERGIKKLNDDGLTIIMISHQVERQKKLANRLIGLKDGKLDLEEEI